MNALVISDSTHGDTEKIAQAIGKALDGQVLRVADVNTAELKSINLLIIGSPIHGGWFAEGIRDLHRASLALEGVNTAAFDTRTKKSMFGFAAPRMARVLEKNGGKLLAPPEGFIVLGIHGPLVDGELDRAADWAQSLRPHLE